MIFTWVKKYLAPPVFADQEKNRLAATLHVILLTLLATAIFLIADDWFTRRGANFPAMSFLGLFVLASLWLTHCGQLRLPRLLTPVIVLAVVSYIIYVNNLGVHDIAMLSYPGIIILAGLLLDKRAPLIFAGLCLGVIAILRYVEIQGGLASRFGALTDFSVLISISVILGVTAALTYILMHNLMDSLAQARRNEASVIESHRQLQAYTQRLEEQEHALHEIEARFNIIVENSTDIIYIANQQRHVTFISAQVAKFGITPEQVIGRSFLDFIHPDDRERLLANMEREIATNVDIPSEFRAVAPDGRIVLFEERGHIIRQGDQVMGIFGIIRDVTERRRAEEALRESEQKFRSIAEQVQDVIAITDARGLITYISPSCAIVFGRPAADMLNHPFTEFLAAPDVPLALAEFEKSIAAGQDAVELNLHMQRADGVEFVGGLRATVLHQEGVIAGTIGVIRDITERDRAEMQIRASEHLLRVIVENAPVRVFWKDAELRYLGCNTAFARDAGHSRPEDLIGKDDFQMGWHEQAERYRADDQRVMNSNTPKLGYEEPQTTPDGHTIWLRTSKVPLRDADGKSLGILGIYEDITEQKQVEEVLALNEKRLRQIIDLVPHFIFARDRDGRFILVNQAIAEAYGTTVQELTGKGDADFIKSEEEVRHFREDDNEVLNSGLPKIIPEEQITDAAGHVRILSTQKIPFTFSGATLPSLLGVSVDITERKRAEAQIRTALQEKEVLLREIHHRVKNNLQVISSLLNLQARTLSAECGRSAFDESQHRIRAMALIHEKLYQSNSLSRIDFNDYTTSLVRHLHTSYGNTAQAIWVEVHVNQVYLTIDLAIPCGLIINELVSNAFKYAFPQGRGMIKIALTKITSGGYEFIVSDDGVGLPTDFDLDRLDSLGLQLVRGLVEEQLGGQLYLLRGQGTTWHIRF